MNVTILPAAPASQTFRTCMASADCRYRTFDGVSFEYCSTCTMTLVRSAALEITAATECDPTDKCQCIRSVSWRWGRGWGGGRQRWGTGGKGRETDKDRQRQR